MSPYYAQLRQQIGSGLLLVPAVAGLVHDSAGRLLLQRKADGSWSLPAGAIEPGETPQQAMERELREETGLRAEKFTLAACLGGAAYRHTYPHGQAVEYVLLLFHCESCTSEGALLDEETIELRYFGAPDFPGLALPYPMDLLYPA